jgi:aspartate aminotransferase
MADRIIGMRSTLYDILTKELGSKKDWTHIKSQIGSSPPSLLSPLSPL